LVADKDKEKKDKKEKKEKDKEKDKDKDKDKDKEKPADVKPMPSALSLVTEKDKEKDPGTPLTPISGTLKHLLPTGPWRKLFQDEYTALISLYREFATNQVVTPSILNPEVGDPLVNFKLISRLFNFSHEYHLYEGWKTQQRIEDVHSRLTSTIFQQFEEAYDGNDREKLRSTYRLLDALGEHKIAAQRFIAKNELFMNLSIIQQIAQDIKVDVPIPQKFCEGLETVCQEQFSIIDEVFKEDGKPIQILFVERIFGQSISEYGDYILEKAENDSNIVYIRTLVSLYEACLSLIKKLSSTLDHVQLLELLAVTFAKHSEQYLKCEMSYLTTSCEQKINAWKNNTVDKRRGTLSDINAKIDRKANLSALLSVELCLELIYDNKNAVKRAMVVSYKEDLKKNVEEIFTLMLKTIGSEHVEPTMKFVIDTLAKINDHETSEQFSVSNQLFDLIHIADLIQQLIDKYYEEDIVPIIPKDSVRNRCLVQKKSFEKQLDESVATCFDLIIEYMIKRVEFLLKTYQIQDDFTRSWKAKQPQPSPACVLSVECVDSHLKKLIGCTEKSTLTALYTEIGTRFFHTLCDHFKRYKISVDGSAQLTCDLDKYYEFVSQMGIPKVKKQFQSLREVGKLFKVPADGLKKLLEDEQKFEVDDFTMEELRTFLRLSRADYRDPKVAKVIDGEVCSIA